MDEAKDKTILSGQMEESYASSICPDKIFFVQDNFEIV